MVTVFSGERKEIRTERLIVQLATVRVKQVDRDALVENVGHVLTSNEIFKFASYFSIAI